MNAPYLSPAEAPARAEVDVLPGPTVLEFGTDWCGHCRAATPLVLAALAPHGKVRHLKVEDGPGRALGRSFAVRRWPTLVFLVDGREVERLVRPDDPVRLAQVLHAIDP